MDFFSKLSVKGKEAADKAKDLAEIAALKAQIVTSESVIKKTYTEIGKLYYEQHAQEAVDESMKSQFETIEKEKKEIADLQAKIDVIKGGKDVADGDVTEVAEEAPVEEVPAEEPVSQEPTDTL